MLADGAQVTGGANAVAIGGADDNVCHNKTGDREHHCMLVPRGGVDIGGGGNLPCNPDSCHVNLVVEARSGAAGPGTSWSSAASGPTARSSRTRAGSTWCARGEGRTCRPTSLSTTARVHKALPLNLSKQVVYSQKIEALRDREQLEVEAR